MTSTSRSRRAHASPSAGLLLAVGLALLPTVLLAKQSDRQQPMTIDNTGGNFDGFNAPNTVTTLTGPHIVITQGSLQVTGTIAKIYIDGDQQISRVVVHGKPAHIQQLDDSNNLMTGDAAQLDYDNVKGIAVLTGNAVVKQQGRGEAHGDKLTYDTQNSHMTGESSGNNVVHMVFLPKNKPAAPAPAAPTPKKP